MSTSTVRGAKKIDVWRSLLSKSSGPLREAFRRTYGDEPSVLDHKQQKTLTVLEAFAAAFDEPAGCDAEVLVVRSCGRVNLMGMHVDHRGGFVNPVAFGDVIVIAQRRDDDRVILKNYEPERFGDRSFTIHDELPVGEKIDDWDRWTQANLERLRSEGLMGDWSNYIKSAVLYLQHIHTRDDGTFDPALRGMNLMVYGTLPVSAGLSSSSSIVVGAMQACRRINDIHMDDMATVEACRLAEWFVGTRGGGGDHAAIQFGRRDCVTHIGAFPVSVDWVPFPPEYRIVLANSLQMAEKSAGARDMFNQRVAAYVFGLLMIRKNFPQYAEHLGQLRDLNPGILGVDDAQVVRMLRSLPERARRDQILQTLDDQVELVRHTFGSHAEPADGYDIRQVCMFGVAECMRAEMAVDLLRAGDIEGFGELLNISHDGDRVTRLDHGKRVAVLNRYGDEKLDALVVDLTSGDEVRRARARLHRQPGGYNVRIEALDVLVDIAR